MYDPELGRWISPDILGKHFSLYMAMGNNPVSRVDTDGADDIYYDQAGREIAELRVVKAGPVRHFMQHHHGAFKRGGMNFIQVNSQQTIRGADNGEGWNGLTSYSNEVLARMVAKGLLGIDNSMEFASESRTGGIRL